MQCEHQHYAELRSIKKLGHYTENDDAEMLIEHEREEREKNRRQLRQELAQLKAEKKQDPERKAYLEDQLDQMRQQDDLKIAEYMQTLPEYFELIHKAKK